jgi:hypothetical protein
MANLFRFGVPKRWLKISRGTQAVDLDADFAVSETYALAGGVE